MTGKEKENLAQLFKSFMEDKAAQEMTRDIEKGDELFSAFPAPQPSEKAVARIKNQIAITLNARKTAYAFKQRVWMGAAVAAMLAIAAFLTLRYGQISTSKPAPNIQIASAVWDGSDDADVSVLIDEVQTMQNTIKGVQVTDTSSGSNIAESDIEMELIEIGSDIWKG